ncbi:MAG: YdbH domain-containing protein, partial [Alphaproteobacteria bacterium]|nr:YdbH domain-containing protein [Alphaproteobacteria bacterium]
GVFRPRFAASGGKLALPGLDLSADDIAASWTGEEDQPRLSLSTLLRHTAAQPAVVPLRLAAGVRREGDALAFAGTLTDITRRLVLDFSGSHDTATQQGRGRVVAKPIAFSPEGLQPRHLFPLLAAHLDEVEGRIALAGPLSWSDSGLAPDLDLLVEDLTATTHGVTLKRVNSVVAIERIVPFSTPIGQLAAVALIDAGVPLEDGVVIFRLEGKRLTIGRAELKLAGGRVMLGETVFDPAAERQRIALNVSGVDVGKLVEMAGTKGLSASGTLSGRVPLSIVEGAVTVDHGYLAATAPGRLRYRPDLPPATLRSGGQSMELLLKALDDFHYSSLSMTLNGRAGGEIKAEFRITGFNPDLYDGYPIELNLNISGALDRILDQTLAGYQIPERIRERMSAFGGRLRGAGEDR